MKQILLTCSLFWASLVHDSNAQFTGKICLNCNDVSSPKHCRDTSICGQGEICYTKEFVDHNGLTGFHLGCQDYQMCELVQHAQTLFGKRDVTEVNLAPPDRCHECCAKDLCNNELCEGSSWDTATPSLPTKTTNKGVTCMSCAGVESPEHCRQKTMCGSNEICYTREYTDLEGHQGFHMGCESQESCRLLLNAETLFGKRHVPEPPPPGQCYDCCSTDGCNSKLCQGSSYGCLDGFVRYKDNCYLIELKDIYQQPEARRYCQGLGADLVSIKSEEENAFLAKELTYRNVASVAGLWTAGIYSHANKEWEWLDGSPFIYTHWYPDYPHSSHTSPVDLYVLLSNPISNPSYKTALWRITAAYDFNSGFICKMQL